MVIKPNSKAKKATPPKHSQAPQLGRVAHETAEHPAIGIKPRQLIRLLEEAETGDLKRQHELFMDMEERDAHLFAELSKRKRALLSLNWQIAPPEDASKEEENAANVLTEAIDEHIRDLMFDLLDGIGHGFSACEIEWQLEEGLWLPKRFIHRPQTWFTLDPKDANKLMLRSDKGDPLELQPLGWIIHKPRARSGYIARAGLFRVLAMPYLMKHYALHHLNEFLEIYGLPLRLGKFPAGSDESQQKKLMNLVKSMGHSAAGIVPDSMVVDFIEAAKGNADNFQTMQRACDEAISKAILGGTLTSNTSESGGGAHALGQVHNEVRRDLMEADAQQLAATLTRDLIAPFCAINFAGVRSPRFVFDLNQPADMGMMANALPPLTNSGLKIPENWLYQQLGIPVPEEGEAVLQPAARPEALTRQIANRQISALSKGEKWQKIIDSAVPLRPNASAINAPLLAALQSAASEEEALDLLSKALPDYAPEDVIDELNRLMFSAEMAGRLSFEKVG